MTTAAELFAVQETDLAIDAAVARLNEVESRLGESEELIAARERADQCREKIRPLQASQPAAYRGAIQPNGCTALCDAAHNAVEAVVRYGADLHDHDFDVNAIVFVITDGGENASSTAARDVKQALARAARDGKLSSVVSILVGVAVDTAALSAELQRFRRDVGFDEYIELQRADAATLARLASFVSRSISVQSQSLAAGSGKQVLGF